MKFVCSLTSGRHDLSRSWLALALVVALAPVRVAIGADPMPNACPVDGCEVRIVAVEKAGEELELTYQANFTPDVAKGHARAFGDFLYAGHELFPLFLGEHGYLKPDHLTIVRGIDTDIGELNRLLDVFSDAPDGLAQRFLRSGFASCIIIEERAQFFRRNRRRILIGCIVREPRQEPFV